MRVLTFNVWSDARTWQRRLPAIYDTLRDMEFDLVALQGVPVDDEGGPGVAQRIAEQAGYPYAEFRPYAPGEKDGLAVLSRTRLDDVKSGRDSGREGLEECALRVTTRIQGQALVLTNVHLDAGGIDRREQEILALNGWIEGHPSSGLDLLCGDFNCSPASSVYRRPSPEAPPPSNPHSPEEGPPNASVLERSHRWRFPADSRSGIIARSWWPSRPTWRHPPGRARDTARSGLGFGSVVASVFPASGCSG